eukprot:3492211-Ditylum_brightwellii.AAC.1
MITVDRIPMKQLAAWLEEKGTSVGIWHECFTLQSKICLEEEVDALENNVGNYFFKQAKEIKMPLHQNNKRGSKQKAQLTDEQQDDHDTTDDISIVKAVELIVPKEKRAKWVLELGIPKDLAALIKAINFSVHSLVVYAIANNTTQNAREAAADSINTRLTILEDLVGSKYGNAVWVDYPNICHVPGRTECHLRWQTEQSIP